MQYTRFGRTELRMPVFSAGFMRSMQSWQDIDPAAIEEPSQRGMAAVVAEALRLGINHFETARAYGSSERQLGRILPELARDSILLQTKVPAHADPEVFVAEVLDSLRRLQVDRLDLLAIHGLNTHRDLWQACRPGGCLAAARRLQQQGRVGWVGFSSHGPTEVILEAIRHGQDGGFDYVNLHWYAIFQQHTPVLEEAQARDMGVFIISPSDKGGKLYSSPPRLRALSAPLTPMQFNDLFCLARPEIHTLSIGAARPSDFREHVDGLAHLGDRSLIDGIAGRWQEAMRTATGHPWPEAHWSRYPRWEETPGYINIRFILWLHHLVQGWGLLDYARERYTLLGRETAWVPGNTAAGVDRYDLGAIAAAAEMTTEDLVSRLSAAHRQLHGD